MPTLFALLPTFAEGPLPGEGWRGPKWPEVARTGPEKLGEARRGPESSGEGRRGPERSTGARSGFLSTPLGGIGRRALLDWRFFMFRSQRMALGECITKTASFYLASLDDGLAPRGRPLASRTRLLPSHNALLAGTTGY